MRWTCRLLLAAGLLTAPTLALAHNELMRSPRGLDTLLPVNTPATDARRAAAEDHDLHR